MYNTRSGVKIKNFTTNVYLSKGDFMEKRFLVTMLFDFYGDLLTDKQRDAFEKHYLEDLSLNEIGVEQGTTRQAVMDTVKRSEKILQEYEEKLHLVHKFLYRKEKVEQIMSEIDEVANDENSKKIVLIKNMLSEILD